MRRLLLTTVAVLLSGAALAQQPGVNSPFQPVFAIPIDNKANTYSASIAGLAAASSPTDVIQLCGAAGIVTRVSRVEVGGRATTAAPVDVSLVLRSTANTGGTSGTLSPQKLDNNYAAASSTSLFYTANPTLGTIVGNAGAALSTRQVFLGNLTTGAPGTNQIWDFGNRPSSQIVLRSAAQCVSVNLNAQTNSGNLYDVTIEWTENGN